MRLDPPFHLAQSAGDVVLERNPNWAGNVLGDKKAKLDKKKKDRIEKEGRDNDRNAGELVKRAQQARAKAAEARRIVGLWAQAVVRALDKVNGKTQ